MSIIAIIFDYDDTIVPDSISQLLEHYNVDIKKFWEEDFKNLVEAGYNPTNAYLKLILDNIGIGKPLEALTNKKLREFGLTIQRTQYPGLHGLIRELKKTTNEHQDINIEFYVISSGLEEIIRGNKFIEKNFSGIYGCCLAEDGDDSELQYIKRSITFTEKTRYLFEINKGISLIESYKDPFAVNKDIKINERRIPFKNMVYIGDGLTDIPCFSLLKQYGGMGFGILDTDKTASAKINIFKKILKPGRVLGTYVPRYGKKEDLGQLIRIAVENITTNIVLGKATD